MLRPLLTMNWLAWSLASAAFAAVTALLAKAGVAGVDSNLATAIRTSVVVAITWAIALGSPGLGSLGQVPARSWLFLTLSGIATGLSWLCYFRALQLGPASRVAPIDKLSVVLVIVMAALFMGERITLAKALGGLAIAAGAVLIAAE